MKEEKTVTADPHVAHSAKLQNPKHIKKQSQVNLEGQVESVRVSGQNRTGWYTTGSSELTDSRGGRAEAHGNKQYGCNE